MHYSPLEDAARLKAARPMPNMTGRLPAPLIRSLIQAHLCSLNVLCVLERAGGTEAGQVMDSGKRALGERQESDKRSFCPWPG